MESSLPDRGGKPQVAGACTTQLPYSQWIACSTAETLEEFDEVISTVRDFNLDLEGRSLLSKALSNCNETEPEDVSEFIAEYPQVKPLETVLDSREAYRDALTSLLPVVSAFRRGSRRLGRKG